MGSTSSWLNRLGPDWDICCHEIAKELVVVSMDLVVVSMELVVVSKELVIFALDLPEICLY